jgi:hypothetical protein
MFRAWFERRREDRYQQGCCDRINGLLPQSEDFTYLYGYFANRPEGMDDLVQHFSSAEAYLVWKQKSLKPRHQR